MTTDTMTAGDYTRLVAREICDALSRTDDAQVETLLDMIEEAQNIFLGGAGRSGLMARAFAIQPSAIYGELRMLANRIRPGASRVALVDRRAL